jgi:uncharacterized protein (TIGR02466 family)
MGIIPLYSKVFYRDIIDIGDEDFLLLQNNVKNSFFTIASDEIKKPSLINDDYEILDKPQFQKIKNLIMEKFYMFMRDHMKISNDFKISSSWLTKTEPDHFSHSHKHHNCYYSGVFYVDTDENGGDIIFENVFDQRFLLNNIEQNVYNTRFVNFKTKNKMIIFFPSEIHHKISVNKTNKDRYSIAFNFYPIGKIGDHDSSVSIS